MGVLEEMLLRNGLIFHGDDGKDSYINGSVLSNSLVVCDGNGRVTHRVEKSANGVDLVVVSASTGRVVQRIENGAFLAA